MLGHASNVDWHASKKRKMVALPESGVLVCQNTTGERPCGNISSEFPNQLPFISQILGNWSRLIKCDSSKNYAALKNKMTSFFRSCLNLQKDK